MLFKILRDKADKIARCRRMIMLAGPDYCRRRRQVRVSIRTQASPSCLAIASADSGITASPNPAFAQAIR